MQTLVTGVTGQDGSYLAELIAAERGLVTGLTSPHEPIPDCLQELAGQGKLTLVPCDLSDAAQFRHLLRQLAPNPVFHLAAVSQPLECERDPDRTRKINVVSCEVLLDWQKRDSPAARVLLASSGTVFAAESDGPQSEGSPPQPQGEYASQKQQVRELAAAARGAGAFVACAIPFNHESERRSEDFVFAKVCNSAARIALGQQDQLRLGDMQAVRDWGYAPEYVQAMRWMLDVPQPLELILATGESHSVRELVEAAFARAGVDPRERVFADWQPGVDSRGARMLMADPDRAWRELGWRAQTKFAGLVERLVDGALERYGASR